MPVAPRRPRLPRRNRGGRARKSSAPLVDERTVINISSTPLTDPEQQLLGKGLTFCPTAPSVNKVQFTADLHGFYRRLRLRDYFADKPDANRTDTSALENTNLRRRSLWQPPKGSTTPEVECFVKVFHESVRKATGSGTSTRLLQAQNLSEDEQLALQRLQRRRDIVIRPADKGSAVVIQDTKDYHREVMRQLGDEKFYKLLDRDPTAKNNTRVREAVHNLRAKGIINAKTATDLVEKRAKSPHFYTIPKIHKSIETPPGRPIVSSICAPTERISAYVDLILKPIAQSLPSYVRDTKHFLVQLQSLPELPPNALLFTMDVVGLYNNIPHEDGLRACKTMLDRRQTCDPPTGDVIDLAKLVLTLNCFQYEDKFYSQIHGTAMGTRMAPSFANVFMGCLEEDMLATAPGGKIPTLYRRFIDDVFGIWLGDEESLPQFFNHANSCHPTIRFTYTYGLTVPYLDTRVSLDNSHIITDLFEKPTNTHQYLLPSSSHPPHVHRNLPYGLGIRIRAIVSEPDTLNRRLDELCRFLKKRGFSESVINHQLTKVRSIPREEVLVSRKGQQKNENRVPLVCTWHPALVSLPHLLRSAFPIMETNYRLKNLFDVPLVSFRRPKNLRDLLVHTRPTPPRLNCAPPGTYPCKATRCKTCAETKNITEISFNSGRTHSVTCHFTCDSSSVIYLLSCTTCNAAYVGETGCKLRERLNHHRSNIRNNDDTPVAEHFRGQHALRVTVLSAAPEDVVQRRLIEKMWIERLKDTTWHVINRDNGIDALTLDL